MKALLIAGAVFAATVVSTGAQADEDCYEPVANWRPKSQLLQYLQSSGWQVMRIKVDDGCYEVEGVNPEGQRVEATFSPSTFESMGQEYEGDEDEENEHERLAPSVDSQTFTPAQPPANSLINARPKVSVQ